jgi:hypothetical protein
VSHGTVLCTNFAMVCSSRREGGGGHVQRWELRTQSCAKRQPTRGHVTLVICLLIGLAMTRALSLPLRRLAAPATSIAGGQTPAHILNKPDPLKARRVVCARLLWVHQTAGGW